MSQNDFSIANQTFPATRTDLNNALQALASLSSGATAPATTYANMLWYDTSTNILKMRSEADDAWISMFYLDQTANALRVLDDTQVVNTSGTQTGLLGDQATATWEAGTGTTKSLVSPADVAAAIAALGAVGPFTTKNLFGAGTTGNVDFTVTGYAGARFMLMVRNNGGAAGTIKINVSDGAFGTAQSLVSIAAGNQDVVSGYWNEATGEVSGASINLTPGTLVSATVTKTSSITTLRFTGGANLTFSVHLMPDGGAE